MKIEKQKEKILSEKEFRDFTKGCFYQDELREHDRNLRQVKEKNVCRQAYQDFLDVCERVVKDKGKTGVECAMAFENIKKLCQ